MSRSVAVGRFFSKELVKRFLKGMSGGGVKKISADIDGGTDISVPAYAWTLGAKFLPAKDYCGDLDGCKGGLDSSATLEDLKSCMTEQTLEIHRVRKPEQFKLLSEKVAKVNAFRLPTHWSPEEVGRPYTDNDACVAGLFKDARHTPREYWWLNETYGF